MFVLVLALVVAIAIKIVGALLTIAFLIMPAAAARPLSETPEQMALFAAIFGMLAVAVGPVPVGRPSIRRAARRSCWCWRCSPGVDLSRPCCADVAKPPHDSVDLW